MFIKSCLYLHYFYLGIFISSLRVLFCLNPLNAELNSIRHLLALVGARHIVRVSRIRVNFVTFFCVSIISYLPSQLGLIPLSFLLLGR